jgi:hypothetical protein
MPTVSLPSIIYCKFRAYLQNRYMRYNLYSGRPCENSLQRRRVEGRQLIYTKYLRKFIWLVYGIYVFKNSVLVFICELANRRRQRLPIHRFYSHIQVRKSRKQYCCAPLGRFGALQVRKVLSSVLTNREKNWKGLWESLAHWVHAVQPYYGCKSDWSIRQKIF